MNHTAALSQFPPDSRVIALSGGVGGAKLALGLAHVLAPEQLTIVANTADDFEHLGLAISPDLDTVMYTLADLNDVEQGWGVRDETFHAMDALQRLGGETWFRLGDRDLATHLERTQRLREGAGLAAVTRSLCAGLGVEQELLPMTDDPVRTFIATASGDLPFQTWFVRERCEPVVSGYHFRGIDTARPHPRLLAALADPKLAAIVICPSNPFVSVDPILQLPGLRAALAASAAPLVAVSPIVGGSAIKGPAATMLRQLGRPVSAAGVAGFYGSLLDGFVLDATDSEQQAAVRDLGMECCSAQTIMRTLPDRIALARAVLAFAMRLQRS